MAMQITNAVWVPLSLCRFRPAPAPVPATPPPLPAMIIDVPTISTTAGTPTARMISRKLQTFANSTERLVEITVPTAKRGAPPPGLPSMVMLKFPARSVEHFGDVVDHDAFLLGAEIIVADRGEDAGEGGEKERDDDVQDVAARRADH